MKTLFLFPKNGLLAWLLLALTMLFTLPAQAQSGSGSNYSWQYDCGNWDLVKAVVFISAESGQNAATDFSLENCSVLVTMYSGTYYEGWDQESLSLAPVLQTAKTLDVPIFFMRVDHADLEPGGFGVQQDE